MHIPCKISYLRGTRGSSRIFKSPSKNEKEAPKQMTSKQVLVGIKAAIGIVLLVVVLASSVLSKLTLVTLTDQLRAAKNKDDQVENKDDQVTFYWYIQFVLLIPSFITLVRCFVVGVFGKTSKSFPWPSGKAILYVSVL